jgi:hypothetical protein
MEWFGRGSILVSQKVAHQQEAVERGVYFLPQAVQTSHGVRGASYVNSVARHVISVITRYKIRHITKYTSYDSLET